MACNGSICPNSCKRHLSLETEYGVQIGSKPLAVGCDAPCPCCQTKSQNPCAARRMGDGRVLVKAWRDVSSSAEHVSPSQREPAAVRCLFSPTDKLGNEHPTSKSLRLRAPAGCSSWIKVFHVLICACGRSAWLYWMPKPTSCRRRGVHPRLMTRSSSVPPC